VVFVYFCLFFFFFFFFPCLVLVGWNSPSALPPVGLPHRQLASQRDLDEPKDLSSLCRLHHLRSPSRRKPARTARAILAESCPGAPLRSAPAGRILVPAKGPARLSRRGLCGRGPPSPPFGVPCKLASRYLSRAAGRAAPGTARAPRAAVGSPRVYCGGSPTPRRPVSSVNSAVPG